MAQTLFITGTDTGVGKTVLTALLAQFLRAHGVKAAALKPICSGDRADARKIFAALNGTLPLDEINPWHFRAAIAPTLAAEREKKTVPLAPVLVHLRAMQKKFDVVLVEGAGGLLSPLGVCGGGRWRSQKTSALTGCRYKQNFDSRDLIAALRATPVVVAQNRLGAVNHILLTLEVLPKNLRDGARVVLMSPPKPDSATATNAKLLGRFVSNTKIFTLPWLGEKLCFADALKNRQAKRTLAALIRF
jgi:dethiobiotin synthetase